MFGDGVKCCYLSAIYVSASLWKCIASCFLINSTENGKWLTVDFIHAIAMCSHFKTIKAKRSMAEMVIKFISIYDASYATLYSMLED